MSDFDNVFDCSELSGESIQQKIAFQNAQGNQSPLAAISGQLL
jgi:hypothetical protein